MDKREFLSQLRGALAYELPPQLVESNLSYYRGYIEEELRKGRRQEEVLAELGDPKLIARSIIDAIKSGADGIPGTADDISFTGGGPIFAEEGQYRTEEPGCNTFDEQGRESCDSQEQFAGGGYGSGSTPRQKTTFRQFDMNGGCGCLGLILVFFLIMSLIGWVIGILSPILAPVCMVLLILWLVERIRENK